MYLSQEMLGTESES